jgi:hypothetical protein
MIHQRRSRRSAVGAAVAVMIVASTPRIGERRPSAEARVIGALRAVTSAQAAYSSAKGYYVAPACLADPSCAGRRFLDPSLAPSPDRDGYRFEFHPGPRASSSPVSGFASFAVTARPIGENRQRRRSFCVDAAAIIYVSRQSRQTAPVLPGRCADTATPLR